MPTLVSSLSMARPRTFAALNEPMFGVLHSSFTSPIREDPRLDRLGCCCPAEVPEVVWGIGDED